MMRFGQLTLEFIERTAIRATRFATVIERDHHFRVGIPQTHARHRAGQRQIVRGHFDVTLGDVFVVHDIPLLTGMANAAPDNKF